jgi:uncharacterized membrane protein YeaQ/YmgE (transglycosylase-associated protein family)
MSGLSTTGMGEVGMEVTSLVTAVVIGLVVGAAGSFLLPEGRTRPPWPAVVLAVVGAAIGTVVAGVLGVAPSRGVNWLELTFQLSFAAAGVAGLAPVRRRRSVGSGRRSPS